MTKKASEKPTNKIANDLCLQMRLQLFKSKTFLETVHINHHQRLFRNKIKMQQKNTHTRIHAHESQVINPSSIFNVLLRKIQEEFFCVADEYGDAVRILMARFA